jgi:hypothetical protein
MYDSEFEACNFILQHLSLVPPEAQGAYQQNQRIMCLGLQ